MTAVRVTVPSKGNGVGAWTAPTSRCTPTRNGCEVASSGLGSTGKITETNQSKRTKHVTNSQRNIATGTNPKVGASSKVEIGELTKATLGHHSEVATVFDVVCTVLVLVPVDSNGA
jgi:hypothetical protein